MSRVTEARLRRWFEQGGEVLCISQRKRLLVFEAGADPSNVLGKTEHKFFKGGAWHTMDDFIADTHPPVPEGYEAEVDWMRALGAIDLDCRTGWIQLGNDRLTHYASIERGDYYRFIRKADPALAKLKELRERAEALPQCLSSDTWVAFATKLLEHSEFTIGMAADVAALSAEGALSIECIAVVEVIGRVVARKGGRRPHLR